MTSEYESRLAEQRRKVADFIKACANESRLNEKVPRRLQNKLNWDYFHGTIDWSHKRESDPRIHLHKVGVAAERMKAKFKGALMKYDQWITVERDYLPPNPILPDFAARSLLLKQLRYAKAETIISDAILRGLMESRITIKIGGKYVTEPRFTKDDVGALVRDEKKVWQLNLEAVPFEGYHIDTENTKDPIYQIEEARVDYNKVLELSSDEQSPDKPFRMDAVKRLIAFPQREQEQAERAARGNYIDIPRLRHRKQVLIQNFYGTVLTEDGEVFEWETDSGEKIPLKNVFCVIGNEDEVLIDPMQNKRWSAKAPFIHADPIRSPSNGRKALMDAGVLVNQAQDELFSLALAGALKAAHNVTWYRKSWIADKRVLSGGIRDGDQVAIDDTCPPNATPIGTVKTGEVPQEVFVMQQTLDRAFAENVISNQIDLSGSLPGKQVRATEVASASTAISDVFDSMSGDIEHDLIEPLAEEALYEIIQNIDDMDQEEVKSCFEDRQDLAEQFLKMSPKKRFEQVAGTFKFGGKGLHGLIANQAKGQMMVNLLSTIMSNPMTQQATESQISPVKIIREIAKGFGMDIEELKPSQAESQMIQQKQLIREQAIAQQAGGQQPGQPANPSQGSQPSPEQPGGGAGIGQGM